MQNLFNDAQLEEFKKERIKKFIVDKLMEEFGNCELSYDQIKIYNTIESFDKLTNKYIIKSYFYLINNKNEKIMDSYIEIPFTIFKK